jgi:hypothetical protein
MLIPLDLKPPLAKSALLAAGCLLVACAGPDGEGTAAAQDSTELPTVIDNLPESVRFAGDSIRWAQFRLRAVEDNALMFLENFGHLPDSLEQVVPLPPGMPLERSYRFDPWGNLLHYQRTSTGFKLRSSGPDRVFDSEDDLYLVWSREPSR